MLSVSQVSALEVSPALAGLEVYEHWLNCLPDGAARAKQAASRRETQLSRCTMSAVMLPAGVNPVVRPATGDVQQAFTALVELYHMQAGARAGQYGMFTLTEKQLSTGYL